MIIEKSQGKKFELIGLHLLLSYTSAGTQLCNECFQSVCRVGILVDDNDNFVTKKIVYIIQGRIALIRPQLPVLVDHLLKDVMGLQSPIICKLVFFDGDFR
ncbi:hypothetical protein QTP88_015564 [Uroleucon formosanum]